MKLSKVVIKNFRSIKDATVDLNPSCRVLVGINESGKSNILKALALLDEARVTTPSDIRFPLEEEADIDEAFVRFIFSFDEAEIKQIYDHTIEKILRKNSTQGIIIKGSKEFDFINFCRARSEGLYRIDVRKATKAPSYYALPKDVYSLEQGWATPSKACPASFSVEDQDTQKSLKDYSLVSVNDYPEIPENYLVSATVENVNEIIGNGILEIIKSKLPDCIYWTYNEQNLLPASIALATFTANPASCIPLKNMFELAGIENIQATITAEQSRPNGLRNLLGRVAKQTTQHIKSIWKEYQSIEILLEPNGTNIDASVRESFNRYDFASRSDGFKRFISFLIMVSVKVKTNQLEDTLLLIDEPEIGLHPSGARYLKDELIKISEKNHVVYSTHSIFMVDKENIGRHLLVKKQNEVTVATGATQSNFVDEEVIYNALGYSIFDNLKTANILFEGWRDKKLFQVAIGHVPKAYKELKSGFQNVGVAHLQGASDAGRVCPILELANRSYIIVSDCDQASKTEQKKFAGIGQWIRWDELSSIAEIVTGEDFIKTGHITGVVSKIKEQHIQLRELSTDSLNLSAGGGKLHCIDSWLGGAMVKDEKKVFLNQIKDELVNSLTHNDIEECFYKYLQALLTAVNGTKADG